MDATGLSALYAVLARTATRLGLDALAIAVDDPVLGRQAFAAGAEARAALAELAADPDARWCARPSPPEPPADLDALRALAGTALRLGRVEPDPDPVAALELSVRALAPVTGVLRTGNLLEATVLPGAHDEVVTALARAELPAGGAVVLHDAGAPAARADDTQGRAELVAVRTRPDTGELEVHLRAGERRTIGRGPLARAGQAAATATLSALTELAPDPAVVAQWRVGWVRTIDTTPDREFLVAVMIRRGAGQSLYGLAAGSSPVEAAARATLHACNRPVTAAPGAPAPESPGRSRPG